MIRVSMSSNSLESSAPAPEPFWAGDDWSCGIVGSIAAEAAGGRSGIEPGIVPAA